MLGVPHAGVFSDIHRSLASSIPESVVTAGSKEPQTAGRAAMSQGKLVRDKIPQIIRSNGLEPVIYTMGSDEYDTRLRDKLREEVEEFIASDSDPGWASTPTRSSPPARRQRSAGSWATLPPDAAALPSSLRRARR